MAGSKNKLKKRKSKRVSKRPSRTPRRVEKKRVERRAFKTSDRASRNQKIPVPAGPITSMIPHPERPVFSIEIGSIDGETTLGDLIVAFPRTREVLMKHGLRFDVEEAGYLYMTLNVFSAMHGLSTNNLIQELHTASKEPPLQPTQPLRPITATATT